MSEINDTESDAFPGTDEESHLTSHDAQLSQRGIELDADDESLLNGAQVSDTQRPPANGFLEQWEMFSEETLKDLEQVCKAGLTPEERATLIKTALRLLGYSATGATVAELEALSDSIAESLPGFLK